jgi:hypothetical protein
MKEWRDADHKVSYYYLRDTGRIVGQVYNLAHTNIYGAKVYSESNEERYLGQYINCESAKKATEHFWNIQERTLPNETTN